MSEKYDRRSYREADSGETYEANPRVISSHNRTTYSRLIHLADNLDFNSPIFDGMIKRNRSLGSAQAFLIELIFSDRIFINEKVKPFCIGEGSNILIASHHMDKVYFERLSSRNAAKTKPNYPPLDPDPIPERSRRIDFLGGRK